MAHGQVAPTHHTPRQSSTDVTHVALQAEGRHARTPGTQRDGEQLLRCGDVHPNPGPGPPPKAPRRELGEARTDSIARWERRTNRTAGKPGGGTTSGERRSRGHAPPTARTAAATSGSSGRRRQRRRRVHRPHGQARAAGDAADTAQRPSDDGAWRWPTARAPHGRRRRPQDPLHRAFLCVGVAVMPLMNTLVRVCLSTECPVALASLQQSVSHRETRTRTVVVNFYSDIA